ncbi:phosphate system positive regulatory protein pho81, partial [Clydaea vesicula]
MRNLQEKKKFIFNDDKKIKNRNSLYSLKDAFEHFQIDLIRLKNFVEVNNTGFRKILKKWDKRSKSCTKEIYLSRQIEIQPCFNGVVLTELTDATTNNLQELESILENLENGKSINIDKYKKNSNVGLYDNEMTYNYSFNNSSEEFLDVETDLIKSINKGQDNLINSFLQNTGERDKLDQEFFSRIFLSVCEKANLELLKLLLQTGQVDSNYSNDINNKTCLHDIAIYGRLDVFELCFKYTNPNLLVLDVYGRQPLHYASMYGHSELVKFLLKITKCENINQVDYEYSSPLVYAIMGNHIKTVEILIEMGSNLEPNSATALIPLCLASQFGYTAIVKLLLEKGANLNASNSDGLNCLHLACREGSLDIVSLLIKHNADVESKDSFHSWTPIFYASSEGHYKICEVLINAGAKVDVKDEFDWHPITYALYKGKIKAATLLVLNNLKDDDNSFTPLSSVSIPSKIPNLSENLDFNVDIDDIPSLSLPPGHNYLEKQSYVQISFEKKHQISAHHKKRKLNNTEYSRFKSKSQNNPTTSLNKKNSPLSIFNSQQLASLQLIISSKPEVGIPYSVVLPLDQDDSEAFTFIVDENKLDETSIQFDVFPTFGTKVIGRGLALPQNLGLSGLKTTDYVDCTLPLFDLNLKLVGEINFECFKVLPFEHSCLSIGGKVETYWKSTTNEKKKKNQLSVNNDSKSANLLEVVTASSLAEEYIEITVFVTNDAIPIILNDLFIRNNEFELGFLTFNKLKEKFSIFEENLQLLKSELKKDEVKQNFVEVGRLLNLGGVTLDFVLEILPAGLGLSIDVHYPANEKQSNELSNSKLNSHLDAILKVVYDQVSKSSDGGKKIIFSSFNPKVCTGLNWKQPNYGVFFRSKCGYEDEVDMEIQDSTSDIESCNSSRLEYFEDKRCGSIKEAIRFCKKGNFLGLFCDARPLVRAPELIKTIKESGLILATFGKVNNEESNLMLQEKSGVDALVNKR